MSKDLSLKIVLALSVAGMLFSGYLSYGELIRQACPLAGACTVVGGVPACVYGFIMYLAVFVITILGLKSKK
ncbi:MAG: hypothetical protein PHC70_00275 [Patescibacteria group bacterium]|nr:hypothetical protein [Patescibacteria group bacterium]